MYDNDRMITGVTSRGMRDFVVLFLHDDVDGEEVEEEEKGGTWFGGILIADGATPEHH